MKFVKENLVMQMQFINVYRPYKESISKEMNYDSDLNLNSMTKLSGWLRYCAWPCVSITQKDNSPCM